MLSFFSLGKCLSMFDYEIETVRSHVCVVSRKGCSQVLYGGCKLMEPKQDFLFFSFYFVPYGVILSVSLSVCQAEGGVVLIRFVLGHPVACTQRALCAPHTSLSCSKITRTPVRARQQQVRLLLAIFCSRIFLEFSFLSSSMKKKRDSIWCVSLRKLFPGNVSSGIYREGRLEGV